MLRDHLYFGLLIFTSACCCCELQATMMAAGTTTTGDNWTFALTLTVGLLPPRGPAD